VMKEGRVSIFGPAQAVMDRMSGKAAQPSNPSAKGLQAQPSVPKPALFNQNLKQEGLGT
jgi:hypothetical protein